MTPYKISLLIFLTASATNSHAISEGGEPTPQVVENAKILYNQLKPAIPELRAAAESGDPESQFFLAEDLVGGPLGVMTNEAHYWYERAAKQGDLYAMYRLGKTKGNTCAILESCPTSEKTAAEWSGTLRKESHRRASKDDSEAMALLYTIEGNRSWLEKSAALGNAESQWKLASLYIDGKGFFLPGKRDEAIENLLRRSAVAGYPRGLMYYSGWLEKNGDIENSLIWLRKSAETGYANAVSAYAYVISSDPTYKKQRNPIEAYALYTLLLDLSDGGGLYHLAEKALKKLKNELTESQINEAMTYASSWKSKHEPLSFFPIKLEY